jgi:hypothetical protein
VRRGSALLQSLFSHRPNAVLGHTEPCHWRCQRLTSRGMVKAVDLYIITCHFLHVSMCGHNFQCARTSSLHQKRLMRVLMCQRNSKIRVHLGARTHCVEVYNPWLCGWPGMHTENLCV